MKATITALLLCVASLAAAQKDTGLLQVTMFNWKIRIPEGYTAIRSEELERMQRRGEQAIENTYGADVVNEARTLFAFKKNQFTYLEANYQPADTTVSDYMESFSGVNELIYGTFEAQMPGAKIDSVTTIENIAGLRFHAYKMHIKTQAMQLDMWMFSRCFGTKEFTVVILAADKKELENMYSAFNNSKFD